MDNDIVNKLQDACKIARRILQQQVVVDVDDLEAVLSNFTPSPPEPLPAKAPEPVRVTASEEHLVPAARPVPSAAKAQPKK